MLLCVTVSVGPERVLVLDISSDSVKVTECEVDNENDPVVLKVSVFVLDDGK